ncbi:MAG: glycoside hydrolase family 16 protein, partial [Clostridiales bacterium]|nr:glycoside hydrolase family 16 protein [Clostridiales bacterium]
MKIRNKCMGAVLACMLTLCSLGFFGCNDGKVSARGKEMFGFGDSYYREVENRYTLNYDEMVYDDWTGDTIDKSKWVISDSVWDQWGTDQNGVRPQNLYIVKDDENPETHLAMQANGAYYDADANAELWKNSAADGINTAACISSVEAFGPGRYDIKMKPCPRIGALTSMWLFSWFNLDDGSVQQNEIDIEIGLEPYMDTVYFTTWTSNYTQTHESYKPGYLVSDGDWHIYSFDWVTDAEIPYVDFYIDGKLSTTITTNVPTTNATISIGIWCPSWAGGGIADGTYNVAPESRMFESDYAQFSWFRYIPFSMGGWEQRPVENRNFDPDYQPEILSTVPTVNKCANGDFERDDASYVYPAFRNNAEAQQTITWDAPWKNYTITNTDDRYYCENSDARIVQDDKDTTGSNHCALIQRGGSLGQWLRAVGDTFRIRISGRYRTENGAIPQLRIAYYNGFATTSMFLDNAVYTWQPAEEWTDFTVELAID